MHKVKIAVLLAVASSFAASSAVAADPTPSPNASQVCKSIRAQVGSSAFKTTYGTNKNHKNALGKCISANAKVISGQVKAAKSTCKAEQTADAAAFAAKYGTNKNKKNAFGKCVSKTVKAQS